MLTALPPTLQVTVLVTSLEPTNRKTIRSFITTCVNLGGKGQRRKERRKCQAEIALTI
jgi:hypothetical protein